MPRIAIHMDEHGNMQVFADKGVSVFCVDERVPNDRIYHMEPAPIPEGMLDGAIGHRGDGSPAATRTKVVEAMIDGKSHLTIVEG